MMLMMMMMMIMIMMAIMMYNHDVTFPAPKYGAIFVPYPADAELL